MALLASPIRVDLGGVGKGYAVDRMAEMLKEWSIDLRLIHGGFSSVLALDAPRRLEGLACDAQPSEGPQPNARPA